MGRKIRLTESAFHSLIRRLVIETKEKMDDEDSDHEDMDNESDYSKMTKEKAIKKIADYLKSELSKNQEEKLKNKIQDKIKIEESRRRYGRYLNEEDDEDKNLSSRKSDRKEKIVIGAGAGISVTGAVAALGSIMGYSESQLTSLIHDITANAGLDNFTGPVTYAMVAAGIALLFKGLDMRQRRKES
jgi:hypothetical protein